MAQEVRKKDMSHKERFVELHKKKSKEFLEESIRRESRLSRLPSEYSRAMKLVSLWLESIDIKVTPLDREPVPLVPDGDPIELPAISFDLLNIRVEISPDIFEWQDYEPRITVARGEMSHGSFLQRTSWSLYTHELEEDSFFDRLICLLGLDPQKVAEPTGQEIDPRERIDEALKSIDGRVEMLINRPGMLTGTSSFHTAETTLTILLDIRASLVGGDFDYREYCHEHYPEIPGPVRCIATHLNTKWEGFDPGFEPDFGEKNDDWIEESSKFVEYAMGEMKSANTPSKVVD